MVDLPGRLAAAGGTVPAAPTRASWAASDGLVGRHDASLVVMGGFEQQRDRVAPVLGPDSPLVRVKGLALMGAVTVVRKPLPGEGRRPRLLGG